MNVALIALTSLLGLAAAGSGFGKLAKVPQVMESMASVGVAPKQVPLLATLEIAGTAGLVLGIWYPALGVVSAVCLALYFLGAVTGHLRKGHGIAEFGPAAAILVIAVAVTALQVTR